MSSSAAQGTPSRLDSSSKTDGVQYSVPILCAVGWLRLL
ncbi:hypothetical protein PC116_g6538 [Phytophthora cactorum]|nr:hypothetical protein PC114_g4266 [Phytophthora cactorum]KAG4245639.1 hypothetical protein PC116_g6538 [Phytophthora cactorum]